MRAMASFMTVGVSLLLLCCGCGTSETAPREDVSGETTPPETADGSAAVAREPSTPAEEPPLFSPTLEIEAEDFVPEAGFEQLSITDFKPFEASGDTWQEIDGVIVCSGNPKGYLYSNESFANFTWRGEYRFAPVAEASKSALANSGFMLHIQTPHKVWPRSLEVQGRFDEMCSIKSNGGVPALTIEDDVAARESARKPIGEWNSIEIVSRNGALTATLNGELVCLSQPGELTAGFIGLQSEMFEVHFRRMRLRRDD